MENFCENIASQIIEANKAYRLGRPIMDDLSFDELCEKYEKMVPKEKYDDFRNMLHEETGKISHPFVMGSLDKLKIEEPDSILKWIKEYVHSGKISISAKIDGISCRIHYDENGEFYSATTRGDGYSGIDVTDKVKFVKGIPKTFSKNTDVRGELVITNADFIPLSATLKNPRNACAGIIGQKFANKDLLKHVSFISYEIMGGKIAKGFQFNILENNNFLVSRNWFIEVNNFDINEFKDWCLKDYGYPTDGLVMSDIDYFAEKEYRPKAQRAIKLSTKLSAISRLTSIDWSHPSKDGRITPVGIIDPVNIGGVTVSRVTLNNLDWMKKNNLMIGSKVQISRSNDVIPKIIMVENYGDETEICVPSICPSCGSPLAIDGVDLRCQSDDCSSKKFVQMRNFIVKLGIKEVSLKTIENWNIDSIDSLLKFYPDNRYKTQIHFYSDLENKLFHDDEITLFKSMNFKNVGEKILDKIISFYGFKSLIDYSNGGTDFQTTRNNYPEGVGQKTIDSFKETVVKNMKMVQKIKDDKRWDGKQWDDLVIEEQAMNFKKSIESESICFTGALDSMTRKEASELAKSHGFIVLNSVNKFLTYLVTNTPDSGSSKNKAAIKFGTKIITEKEFLNLCK